MNRLSTLHSLHSLALLFSIFFFFSVHTKIIAAWSLTTVLDTFGHTWQLSFGSDAEFFCRAHMICLGGCWPLELAFFFKLQSHEAVAARVLFPD